MLGCKYVLPSLSLKQKDGEKPPHTHTEKDWQGKTVYLSLFENGKKRKNRKKVRISTKSMCVSVFQMEKNNVEALCPLGLVNGGENGRKGEGSELKGEIKKEYFIVHNCII